MSGDWTEESRRAAAAAAVREVRFTGCDGLPQGGRKLVDTGVLVATVVTPSNTGPALERLAAWLRTGQVRPTDVLLEPHSYPAESSIRP